MDQSQSDGTGDGLDRPAEPDIPSSVPTFIKNSANIAVYDDLLSTPRIIKIGPAPTRDYIEALATQTYNASKQAGGSISYTVIRQVAENFIHANFKEPVVSILDGGNTIKFADQGPGIKDKEKVQLPGYSSATSDMKEYILGVGSGFPIVKEYMTIQGGKLEIDDNIKDGTVVTLTMEHDAQAPTAPAKPIDEWPAAPIQEEQPIPTVSLSQRKMKQREDNILRLFIEHTSIGPSDVQSSLGISLGTASRTLDALESAGYITSGESKKRVLTEEGIEYLREISLNNLKRP